LIAISIALHRMAGDLRDLRMRAAGAREPDNGGVARILIARVGDALGGRASGG
jgi:hypothetical protein